MHTRQAPLLELVDMNLGHGESALHCCHCWCSQAQDHVNQLQERDLSTGHDLVIQPCAVCAFAADGGPPGHCMRLHQLVASRNGCKRLLVSRCLASELSDRPSPGLQILGDALGGGVRAMSRAERIVNEDVGVGGQLRNAGDRMSESAHHSSVVDSAICPSLPRLRMPLVQPRRDVGTVLKGAAP